MKIAQCQLYTPLYLNGTCGFNLNTRQNDSINIFIVKLVMQAMYVYPMISEQEDHRIGRMTNLCRGIKQLINSKIVYGYQSKRGFLEM